LERRTWPGLADAQRDSLDARLSIPVDHAHDCARNPSLQATIAMKSLV
jgi:hypothetical protein